MPEQVKKLTLLLLAGFIVSAFMLSLQPIDDEAINAFQKLRSSSSPKAPLETKAARSEYFHRMLHDPATGKLPPAVHQREMMHAATMPKIGSSGRRTPSEALNWSEIGPHDVGGRTRALAVDITNPDVLIAGGVSGGIWKSTNRGQSWEMKSTNEQVLSVTYVTQDPRQGHTDTWYYTGGEYNANSATDWGGTAYFHGNALYRSTDRGESWHPLEWGSTESVLWETPFGYASKVLVHPQTGTIYVCANTFGVLRSDDDGENFHVAIPGRRDPRYADIDIASDGTVYASLSGNRTDGLEHGSGVFISTDDGITWEEITPDSLDRSIRNVVVSPKTNPELVYVLNLRGYTDEPVAPNNPYTKEDLQFFVINRETNTVEDRSENLPDFGNHYYDFVHTMGGYSMEMTVKPDDPGLVLIGSASLFRSFDAFATKPSSINQGMIGGYWLPPLYMYPNLHPDIQSFAFDPANPNTLYVGTDGGISFTADIAKSTPSDFMPWENLNNGYNVTQFYTLAIPEGAGDDRIMGGTQDNGTPYLRPNTPSRDISTGDGSYCQFTAEYSYGSGQMGIVGRLEYDSNGDPLHWRTITGVWPSEATGQMFIHPFILDPSNTEIMYYPAGGSLWRNTSLGDIPQGTDAFVGTMVGWSKQATAELPPGYIYSALDMAHNIPGDVLYAAAYNTNGGLPAAIRFEKASQEDITPVNISSPDFPAGGYPHDIEVHPDNNNELIILFSNYNIEGLFHSTDGGNTFDNIEGNLAGTEELTGPSLRNVLIQPVEGGTLYLVGTSTGLYSTNTLNGEETVWELEAPNTLGNVVVSMIKGRTSDGRIAAATHGRGLFETYASIHGTAEAEISVNSLRVTAEAGGMAAGSFTLSNTGATLLEYEVSGMVYWPPPANGAATLSASTPAELPELNFQKSGAKLPTIAAVDAVNTASSVAAHKTDSEVLYLDDGNDTPDTFLGMQDGSDFGWLNEFNFETSFRIDALRFFMRTEEADSNLVNLLFFNELYEPVAGGPVLLDSAPDGRWYTVYLNTPLQMNYNEKIYAGLHTVGSGIQYPAGLDFQATVPGKSTIVDPATGNTYALADLEGYEQAAFLVRLVGETGGGYGVPPEVSFSPATGTISPSESTEITMNFTANELPEGAYEGKVTVIYNGGILELPLEITIDPATSVEQEAAVPEDYALEQNFPNPFNPSTTISFSLKEQGFVEINLFSVSGELVRTITAANYSPGRHEVTLNAEGLSSGVYLYTMRSSEFSAAKKMILMK